MISDNERELKTVQERMADEELISEREDEKGDKWIKVYFGGGAHFKNWLEQCKEMGEVMVEEVDPRGFKCFEEGEEKLYRIWMKMDETKKGDLL
jgi:hypothetical protein